MSILETEATNIEVSVKILHVIGIMNRGGAEAMIMNLYRNIDRTKVQFDFVENSFERAAFDDEIEALGGKIYRCPHFNGKNYLEYKRWWKDFFKEHQGEYHIIHGHIGSTAAIYLKIAKKNGLFTIAHSHSSGTDYSLHDKFYRVLSYNTRNIADYFFACSQAAGVDRYGQKVVQGNNYKVLNNAIDTKLFAYNEELRHKIRNEFNIDKNYVIGHIGRLIPVKNHQFILSIFKKIKKQIPNAKLMLVGDGDLRPQLEAQAKELGIADDVIFTGVRSDINEIVQAMDFFVFPSLYEGLPVTLVEVQTSGLPCVISDKVPDESILTKDLVTVMSLEQSAKEWANHIVSRLGGERFSRVDEIKAKGYDIAETAKWLEEFYLEHNG